jgi:acyl carrier protein
MLPAVSLYARRREEVLGDVRRMLIEKLRVQREPDEIDPDTALFGSGLGFDALDAVELTVCLDVDFGVKLPETGSGGWMRTVNSRRPGSGREGGRPAGVSEVCAASVAEPRPRDVPAICTFVTGGSSGSATDEAGDLPTSRDDGEFIFLPTDRKGSFCAYLEAHLPDAGVTVVQTARRGLLRWPYAWELLALLFEPDVVGLPYLTLFHHDRWICFRAGKTGEYGYGLIVASEASVRVSSISAQLTPQRQARSTGSVRPRELVPFRREGAEPVTPIGLQLQWRVSYKHCVGSDALARRRKGIRSRRPAW